MKHIQLKWFALLILFGSLNPVLMATNIHGFEIMIVGATSWMIFIFATVLYALTRYNTEKEIFSGMINAIKFDD